MLATLADNPTSGRVDDTERLLLQTTQPETTATPPLTIPSSMSTMPTHNPTLHERYKRTSISKPLYAELSHNQFRLLRIVPGTRRGEFTAQMFETDLSSGSIDYEYSILTLAPRPESLVRGRGKRGSNGGSNGNDDEDLTCFPILSLGGGEHQIEIPSKVKRALERVVEEMWDCFHSTQYSDHTSRTWRAGRNGEQKDQDADGLLGDGVAERGSSLEVEDVAANHHDGVDGESDTGEGEDFHLWIRDICVDRTDDADQRQDDKLFGKICEGANGIILAHVPSGFGAKIELERLENLGRWVDFNDQWGRGTFELKYGLKLEDFKALGNRVGWCQQCGRSSSEWNTKFCTGYDEARAMENLLLAV